MKKNEKYLTIGKDNRYNVYHDTIDRQRLLSDILNAGNKNLSIHTTLWDKKNIQSRIFLLTGDINGVYDQSTPSSVRLGIIPQLKKELAGVEDKFTLYLQGRAKLGYKTSESDEWPINLLQERLKLEGTLLVRQEELEVLQKQLTTYVDAEEIEDVSRVLAAGLKCSGRLQGGVLVEMDGQKISIANDGTLYIDCKFSPYHMMAVTDYRELANKWTAVRRKTDELKLKRMQEQAQEQGLPKPERLPNINGKRVNVNALPPWPVGVEKVDPKGEYKEEDSATVMVNGISRKRKQLTLK